MAYQVVKCEVRWVATINEQNGSGGPTNKYRRLGEFEDKGDACRALAEYGLTLDEFGFWIGNYITGSISRELKEIE